MPFTGLNERFLRFSAISYQNNYKIKLKSNDQQNFNYHVFSCNAYIFHVK